MSEIFLCEQTVSPPKNKRVISPRPAVIYDWVVYPRNFKHSPNPCMRVGGGPDPPPTPHICNSTHMAGPYVCILSSLPPPQTKIGTKRLRKISSQATPLPHTCTKKEVAHREISGFWCTAPVPVAHRRRENVRDLTRPPPLFAPPLSN